MAEKAYFTYHVEPQSLDFNSRRSIVRQQKQPSI